MTVMRMIASAERAVGVGCRARRSRATRARSSFEVPEPRRPVVVAEVGSPRAHGNTEFLAAARRPAADPAEALRPGT